MDRPQGDALYDSLAKVAEAYGGTADVARLASVLGGLDLGAVPPELAIAVAETLTYVYALDQAVEGRPLQAPAPTRRLQLPKGSAGTRTQR